MAITVAVVGNPNTGKTTLFNALCGLNQRTGNYPGVTVEQKLGTAVFGEVQFEFVDLPGTYSLAPHSPDEMVALDVLLGRRDGVAPIDAILCVVDANNLERNLFLTSQILELGLPTVVALNMVDVARKHAVDIDIPRLSDRLGAKVVPIQAHKRIGLDDLKRAIADASDSHAEARCCPLPEAVVSEIEELCGKLNGKSDAERSRFLAQRLLLDSGSSQIVEWVAAEDELSRSVDAARERLAASNISLTSIESISRYDWIDRQLKGIVTRPRQQAASWGDRLDRILTHPILGTLFFLLVMMIVFQSIFSWAAPVMDAVDSAVGLVAGWVEGLFPAGALRSLLTDGVIAGVGSVVIFLPQILILFLFIALLEDCGYMARAAYLMDRLMSRVGLSGKSFIPLLSSFACAIPGIMAARVIEHPRDRLVTILIAPLMSCSARLPVYTLLIAAFIPSTTYVGGLVGLQGLVMFAMYAIGVIVAVVVAFVLKKTILKGATPPFVMELPEYRFPSIRTVLLRMFERGWAFLRRAGTLIFSVAIVVWALSYFPRPASVHESVASRYEPQLQQLRGQLSATEEEADRQAIAGQIESAQTRRENETAARYIEQSFLGRAGRAVEPVVRPLGWDWKIAAAAIASFPAREVVIGTLGVIYSLGSDADEESESLRERLRSATWNGTERPVFTVPVALSIMVFFALCAQCASTLVIMYRETGRLLWPVFSFVYMTALAYLGALLTYQVGTWLGW